MVFVRAKRIDRRRSVVHCKGDVFRRDVAFKRALYFKLGGVNVACKPAHVHGSYFARIALVRGVIGANGSIIFYAVQSQAYGIDSVVVLGIEIHLYKFLLAAHSSKLVSWACRSVCSACGVACRICQVAVFRPLCVNLQVKVCVAC